MVTKLLNKQFFLWWISVMLISTLFFWLAVNGIITTIWNTDTTKLTSIIMIVFILNNIYIGITTKQLDSRDISSDLLEHRKQNIWFYSEIIMGLGMLGTVIGLIHMLNTTSIPENADSSAVTTLLWSLWGNMGLALYTNAVGLATSIILKLQVNKILGKFDESRKV